MCSSPPPPINGLLVFLEEEFSFCFHFFLFVATLIVQSEVTSSSTLHVLHVSKLNRKRQIIIYIATAISAHPIDNDKSLLLPFRVDEFLVMATVSDAITSLSLRVIQSHLNSLQLEHV